MQRSPCHCVRLRAAFTHADVPPLSKQQDTGVRQAHKPVQLVNAVNNRNYSKAVTRVLSCTIVPRQAVLAVKKKVGAMDNARSAVLHQEHILLIQ